MVSRGWLYGSCKTKAIRKMVNQLCWEIRPDAVSLVKAFDIPDSCLCANCIVGAITLNLKAAYKSKAILLL
jgi:hypothetical protein